MSNVLFHLDDRLPASLQQQIREQIARAILSGHLLPGKALPSSRRLAKELDVARNTVVLAYEQMVEDGYLLAEPRRGYFVNPAILEGRVEQPAMLEECERDPLSWAAMLARRPSRQKTISKPGDWQSYAYPFLYGQIDPSLFPIQHWRECSRDSMSISAVRGWSVDHLNDDDPELVEQIRTRLLPRRGVWAETDEILITVGAQQALWIACMLLLQHGRRFGMENPGYVDMHHIARTFTDDVQLLPVDDDGLQITPELAACHLVFVTPSHQSPTMATMPLSRRSALLDMAHDNNFLIIEDDYESEANYLEPPTPALKSIDRNNRVIYVGSLSKTLAPGLRVGYMVGAAEFIREARALRRLMLRHPPTNNQRAVALFLQRGYHDALMHRIFQTYRERWEIMTAALSECFPESMVPQSFGGSCFWIKGPHGLDSHHLSRLARQQGILIECGDIHFFDRPRPEYFRLGFSAIDKKRIPEGIEKLSGLISALIP